MKCQRCHKNTTKSGGIYITINTFDPKGFITGEVMLTFCPKCGEKVITGTTQNGPEKPIEQPSMDRDILTAQLGKKEGV